MTTVKIEYRTYIPYDVIAIGYFHINFYGDNKDKYENEWDKIEYAIVHKNDKERKQIEQEIEALKAIKIKWWHFKEQEELENKIHLLEEKLEPLKHDYCDEAFDCHWEAKKYLEKNGFILKSCVPSGKHCNDKIEMWEKI